MVCSKNRWGSLRRIVCVLASFIVLAVLFLAWLIRPLPFQDLVSSPAPASGYEEALTQFAAIHAKEQTLPLSEGGHTILLTHGHPTEAVFVLLHGYTNAPRQFQRLGESLFNAGANVIIPRLPHHGYADRLTDAHADLTARELIIHAEVGLDIAQGLGRRVVLVGLSVSGVTAGWLAHKRHDIDEAWLLAPFFGPFIIPDRLTPSVTATLLRLPNFFQWWDPRKRENLPGPPMNYPRFSSHALGEAMRLGMDAERQSGPVRVRRVGLVLSAADIAVSNRRALRILEEWEATSPGVEFFTYTFPAAERIPHDFIDPLQPDQQIERVYPMLLAWLVGSLTAKSSAAP